MVPVFTCVATFPTVVVDCWKIDNPSHWAGLCHMVALKKGLRGPIHDMVLLCRCEEDLYNIFINIYDNIYQVQLVDKHL